MTTQGFAVSHAKDAHFERGLRSFFEYRDLGIKAATQGRVVAHVIRAAEGTEFASEAHRQAAAVGASRHAKDDQAFIDAVSLDDD